MCSDGKSVCWGDNWLDSNKGFHGRLWDQDGQEVAKVCLPLLSPGRWCPSYLKNVFWNKESYLNDWIRCVSFCSCVLASWIWWKETNALVSFTFDRFVRWNFLNELPASPDCLPCSLWTSCHYSSGRSFNDNGKIWRLYMTEWFVSFKIEKFPLKTF